MLPTSRYHAITPAGARESLRPKSLALSTVRVLAGLPVRLLDIVDFDAEGAPATGWVDVTADAINEIVRVTFRFDAEHGALDDLRIEGELLSGVHPVSKLLERASPVTALCERLLQGARDDQAVGSRF